MQTYTQPTYPTDNQTKNFVMAVEKVDLLNRFSHLVRGHGPVIAAKNIRKELKTAFPSVKFSVTTSKYSMGNSVNIGWVDGPTSNQVDEITDKYASGDFDGQTDCYNYNTTGFNDLFGSAKYISTSRNFSHDFIALCVSDVVARFGGEPITSEEYFKGGAHYWMNQGGVDLGRELNIKTYNTAT